jgi:hypothetical protein
MNNKRVTLSMTLIVLVCFFLPWVQVSCGSSRDTLSGIDLARDGHSELWLIPLCMIAALFFNLARKWSESRELLSLINLVAGLLSAYLMNRERLRVEDSAGIIAVGLTGWFWLGLGSALGLVVVAVLGILKYPRINSLRG